jgi:hypothetical protein
MISSHGTVTVTVTVGRHGKSPARRRAPGRRPGGVPDADPWSESDRRLLACAAVSLSSMCKLRAESFAAAAAAAG